jgi:hypothetical protein
MLLDDMGIPSDLHWKSMPRSLGITLLTAVTKEGGVWTGVDPFQGGPIVKDYDELIANAQPIVCTAKPHALESPSEQLAFRMELAVRRRCAPRLDLALQSRWDTLPRLQGLAEGDRPRRFLLRVLSPAESPEMGLYPKASRAEVKADFHVNRGSTVETQFISFTHKPLWALYYATGGRGLNRRIVVVDTDAVVGRWYNVSEDNNGELNSVMARNFAKDAGEVLLRGAVPPKAIVAHILPETLQAENLGAMGSALVDMAAREPRPSFREWRKAVTPQGEDDAEILCSVVFSAAEATTDDPSLATAWRSSLL